MFITALFCPNDLVVSTASDDAVPEAYVLQDWPTTEGGKLTLQCWKWGYDGQTLRRKRKTLTVQGPVSGTVPIDSLSVYPRRYAKRETTNRILESGEEFWELKAQSLRSYSGWDFQHEMWYPAESRCIIDCQTHIKFHPEADAFVFDHRSKAPHDPWPESIANSKELCNDTMMLLPRDVHGFFLSEKKWGMSDLC